MRYHTQSSIPMAALMEFFLRCHALSPVDGRYAAAAEPLRRFFSEAALIRERVRVEALWFSALAESAAASADGSPSRGGARARCAADTGSAATEAPAARQGHRTAHQS